MATATANVSAARVSSLLSATTNKNNRKGTSSFQPLGLGLRLPTDRFALKSAFYNAASSVPYHCTEHRISMKTATTGAYICRDCGYIYNDRKPFDKVPDDFRCPVCYAPKRRFKPYDLPVAKNANQLDVRKARKDELKTEAAIGKALPIAIVVGLAALVSIYLFLNNQF